MSSLLFEVRRESSSPYINRFLSADTIVPNLYDPQSLNRYSYVRNNPIRYNDPTGHKACDGAGINGSCDQSGVPTTTIQIKIALRSYGVKLKGKWSNRDAHSALMGVEVVAEALAKHSGLSSKDTFSAVFGQLTFSASQGDANKWACTGSGSGVSCTTGKFGLDPRLMAHELAHTFNAVYVNGGYANSPYSVLGGATITDSAGNWITGMRYDPLEGANEWTRGYDGYGQVNGLYDDPSLYHGPVDWDDANSVGEEFADMFMNWAFNSFDSTAAGAARYTWVNGEISRALSVMLP